MAALDRAKSWLEEFLRHQDEVDADPGGVLAEGIPYLAQEFANSSLAGLEGLVRGAGLTSFDLEKAVKTIRERQMDPWINLVDQPTSQGGEGVLNMAEWANRPIDAATEAAAEGVFELTESPAAAAIMSEMETGVATRTAGPQPPRSG